MSQPSPNRRWIWFFATLTGLTVLAIVTLIIYNTSQMLRPEKLEAARELWRQKGPADYRLEYTVRKQESEPETFVVEVRGGKVRSVRLNGRPIDERQNHYYDVPHLFEFVEDFLRLDAQPGRPRTFTRADFAADDGHPVHYVRRVTGTRERLEINVRLVRLAAAE